MKKSLLLASTLLLFVACFTSCKKDDGENMPMRSKIIGKWQVNKIDVTTTSETGTPITVSTTYGAADYIDFKDNIDDDIEAGLGTTRLVGNYAVYVNDDFFIDFSGDKDLSCVVNIVNDKQLQFTGTVVGSNPKETRTFYLSR